VKFTGTDGLKLDISLPRSRDFDYTVMFWFRSSLSYDDLKVSDHILDKRTYLFELPGSPEVPAVGDVARIPAVVASCYISRTKNIGP
jgi:hypothetical protein